MNTAGTRDCHPIEFLAGEAGCPNLLARAGGRRLQETKGGRGADRPGDAFRRVAGNAVEHLGALDEAGEAVLVSGGSLEVESAPMVGREAGGREQVGLEPDVKTLVDAAKAVDELRLDR